MGSDGRKSRYIFSMSDSVLCVSAGRHCTICKNIKEFDGYPGRPAGCQVLTVVSVQHSRLKSIFLTRGPPLVFRYGLRRSLRAGSS